MKQKIAETANIQSLTTWMDALDQVLLNLEDAEMGLSNEGGSRRESGSYYTPADVASHFWRLFWRHHQVSNEESARLFIQNTQFVEPSVGSGIFIFSMLKSLAEFGIGPSAAASVRIQAVDVNLAALDFVRNQIRSLEENFSVSLQSITLEHSDFLKWISNHRSPSSIYVGNPPFISNEKGARWKNVYADFVEAMLQTEEECSISLVVPVSACFSRDYVALRRLFKESGKPLSASSYDNIPDCLFKAGKPESGSNKANSQRCTILNLGGPRDGIVESSALLRWSAKERTGFLEAIPNFHDCTGFDIERQIPRPTDEQLTKYLREADGGHSIREFFSSRGKEAFSVGGVARNFIGIREYQGKMSGIIPIRANKSEESLILLQVLASGLFYKFWRSFGDGFHVTNQIIEQFPISKRLLASCENNLVNADKIWKKRESFAKTKLNSGKIIKSYDFTTAFSKVG